MYCHHKYNIDVMSTEIQYRYIANINKISMCCQYKKISMCCQYKYNIDVLST